MSCILNWIFFLFLNQFSQRLLLNVIRWSNWYRILICEVCTIVWETVIGCTWSNNFSSRIWNLRLGMRLRVYLNQWRKIVLLLRDCCNQLTHSCLRILWHFNRWWPGHINLRYYFVENCFWHKRVLIQVFTTMFGWIYILIYIFLSFQIYLWIKILKLLLLSETIKRCFIVSSCFWHWSETALNTTSTASTTHRIVRTCN